MQTPAQLSKFLLSPQRFMNALKWKSNETKRKVLALNITSDQVSVALTSLNSKTPCVTNPITTNHINHSKRNYDQLVNEIKNLTENENIEGLVVNWPLESNGRLGKSCGRVCHVLDYFAQNNIISHHMPFTLWNGSCKPQQNNDKNNTKSNNSTHYDNDELYNRCMSFSLVPQLNQINGFKSITYGNLKLWEYNKNNDNMNTKNDSILDATSILYDFLMYHQDSNEQSATSDISHDYIDNDDDFDLSHEMTGSMLAA